MKNNYGIVVGYKKITYVCVKRRDELKKSREGLYIYRDYAAIPLHTVRYATKIR